MLNVVVLTGRLTANLELNTTPSGVSVVSFTIAVQRNFVKQGEDRGVDFIDIVAWRKTAEFICNNFKKGEMIGIQGMIQTRFYKDKNGVNRKVFEVIAENVNFTGRKLDNNINKNSGIKNNNVELEHGEYIEEVDNSNLPFQY